MAQKESKDEAVIHRVENRTIEASLLFLPPKNSPWGEVQHCDMLCTGVFMVTTAGHGGTMVSKDMAAILSPAARKCGFNHRGYICYEEDTQEDVVFRELLDKKLWIIPNRIKDKAAYEENINNSLKKYNPDYWKARQRGLETIRQTITAPCHTLEDERSAE